MKTSDRISLIAVVSFLAVFVATIILLTIFPVNEIELGRYVCKEDGSVIEVISKDKIKLSGLIIEEKMVEPIQSFYDENFNVQAYFREPVSYSYIKQYRFVAIPIGEEGLTMMMRVDLKESTIHYFNKDFILEGK